MNKIKTALPARLQQALPAIVPWLILAALCVVPAAQAEPYLAIQEGYKCSKCHVNMTGGGKRTDFANIYVQTRLSSNFLNWRDYLPALDEDEDTEENPPKSDSSSSFFSGRLNDYIAIGGDHRTLYERVDTPGAGMDDGFNQEKYNIYLEVNLIPERLLLYQTIDGDDFPERFGLLMGKLGGEPYYVKAGQFFLPYGLRLQDDSAFTRGETGFTYGSGDVGLEFGFEPGFWALHIAVTNGGVLESNSHRRTTASLAYVRKKFRVGTSFSQNKLGSGAKEDTYGIHAGAQFGRTGLLFETNVKDDSEDKEFTSILELNLLVARGHNVKLSYEYFDPSEDIYDNAIERYSLVYEPFLNQFLQARIGARDNSGIPQDPSQNTTSYFAEIHLFF